VFGCVCFSMSECGVRCFYVFGCLCVVVFCVVVCMCGVGVYLGVV